GGVVAPCNRIPDFFPEEGSRHETHEFREGPVPDRPVGGRGRGLVVAPDRPGRVRREAAVRRVPEGARGGQEHADRPPAEAGGGGGAGGDPGVGRERVSRVRVDREGPRVVPRYRGTRAVGGRRL